MDKPCEICGDPVSVMPNQEPRCPLCWDMPLPNRFIATDPRWTDAKWEAWHRGKLMDEAIQGYDAELDLDWYDADGMAMEAALAPLDALGLALMDEATAGYDADADLHASGEMAR